LKPIQKKKTTQTDGKIRLLGGRWRRRVLPVANAEGLRPTGSRVRETLFNWLTPHLHNAQCLDLFAGTGALGLEALSRGAAHVQFVETHKPTFETLAANLRTLKAETNEYALEHGDALQFLKSLSGNDLANNTSSQAEPKFKLNKQRPRFDIIFLDPPFQDNLWQQSLDLLVKATIVSSDALIYVERPRETKIKTPATWHEHRSLNAGTINATLYTLDSC